MQHIKIMHMKSAWLVLALSFSSIACHGGSNQNGGNDMAPVGCPPTTPAADTLRPMRDACTFMAGAMPADSLGVTDAARAAIPIKHVIVVMKENRSFDHLFGQLSVSGQPDAEAVPAGFDNPDASGATRVARFHQTNTCFHADPPHQWVEMHTQSDGGKMDGFVKSG